MVWRYAYCFLRILKLFFLHFNLDIFSSLYATDMYREYMPCIGNPAYSFRPILLKLYRYFAAFLWFHMRNLSLAGYNCSGGASCMACSFIPLCELGERGGSVVECRTPEREVGGSKPTAAMLCPWARHFTPRKYWLITQEAVAPSRHDWKIVDWDVKPQHKQTNFVNFVIFWPQILWKSNSGYLVSATPHTILYRSLCNFAHVFAMVWRCARGLDIILELIFVTFSTLWTLSFLTSDSMKVYNRQWLPC